MAGLQRVPGPVPGSLEALGRAIGALSLDPLALADCDGVHEGLRDR